MSDNSQPQILPFIDSEDRPDVERLLTAWSTATERLQATHEALREQVRRLSDELEIKNRELARKNRLADLGQLASHVAHEVRNGLMPITLYASLLRRRMASDAGSTEFLEKIETGLTALDTIVNDLLHFTTDRQPQKSTFDTRELIRDVCEALRPQCDAHNIVVELDVPQTLTLSADHDMVRRALLNLILNALDVMPNGGELTIIGCETKYGVEIEIADSGPGLPDDAAVNLFEPFYTTKSGGTGLGLALVLRTAQVHGGEVTAANCPQGGAGFTLKFPRQQVDQPLKAAA